MGLKTCFFMIFSDTHDQSTTYKHFLGCTTPLLLQKEAKMTFTGTWQQICPNPGIHSLESQDFQKNTGGIKHV